MVFRNRIRIAVFAAVFAVLSIRSAEAEDKQWVSFSDEASGESSLAADWTRDSGGSPLTSVDSEPSSTAFSLRSQEKTPELRMDSSAPSVRTSLVEKVSKPVPTSGKNRVSETSGNVPGDVKTQAGAQAVGTGDLSRPVNASTAQASEMVSEKNTVLPEEESSFKVPESRPASKESFPQSQAVKKDLMKDLFPDAPVFEEEDSGISDDSSAEPASKAISPEALPREASKPSKVLAEDDNIEIFADHLPSAEVFWISDAAGVVPGSWQSDHFAFSEGPKEGTPRRRIQVSPGGEEYAGISLKPSPEGIYRIRFGGVHAVSRLRIRLGLEDSENAPASKASVYLRIWLGQHAVKRIRYFNEKAWREEVIDLGPAAFLKTPLVVTFEVTSDEPLDRSFNFFVRTE